MIAGRGGHERAQASGRDDVDAEGVTFLAVVRDRDEVPGARLLDRRQPGDRRRTLPAANKEAALLMQASQAVIGSSSAHARHGAAGWILSQVPLGRA